MSRVFIVAAKRTPFGRFRGALADRGPVELAVAAGNGALAGLDRSVIDQVILGNVLSAGQGMNVARQVAVGLQLPLTTPAFTINMMCGSGMQSALLGAQAIKAGEAQVVLVGGTESMTQSPFLLARPGKGETLPESNISEHAVDSMLTDGLVDSFSQRTMAETVEDIAEEMKISRREQDAWAERSQRLYSKALVEGKFAEELVAVDDCVQDEHPRPDANRQSLAALKPLFESDGTTPAGTITAGNASGVNDGAAILLLASEEATRKHGWKPMAQLTAGTSTGCDPQRMGLGPVHAIRKLLAQLGKNLQDFDRVEINEAFAAQVLACLRQLEVRVNLAQPDVSTGILAGIPIQLNGHGGAIAVGHPLAASGARLLTHLAWQIAQGRSKNGLASLCIGGGMGIAATLSAP